MYADYIAIAKLKRNVCLEKDDPVFSCIAENVIFCPLIGRMGKKVTCIIIDCGSGTEKGGYFEELVVIFLTNKFSLQS